MKQCFKSQVRHKSCKEGKNIAERDSPPVGFESRTPRSENQCSTAL